MWLNTLYMQIKVSKRLFSLSAFYHSFFVWWQSRVFCDCFVFSVFFMRFIHDPPAQILEAIQRYYTKNWLIDLLIDWVSNVLTFQHLNLPIQPSHAIEFRLIRFSSDNSLTFDLAVLVTEASLQSLLGFSKFKCSNCNFVCLLYFP